MLKKLLKHEFRAVSRFLLPIHLLLLIACVIGRFVFQLLLQLQIESPLFSLILLFFLLFLIAVPFVTSIYIAVRYYKTLYTDEGYLTFTLPVSRGQLLFSKAFVACVWSVLDTVFLFAGFAIIFLIPNVLEHFSTFYTELEKSLHMAPDLFFFATLAVGLIGIFGNVALYYFSISMGQILSSHRVLGSIVSYFIISTLISMLTFLLMFAVGYNPFSMSGVSDSATKSLLNAYFAASVFSIIEAIVLFGGTYYLLQKKLNLN